MKKYALPALVTGLFCCVLTLRAGMAGSPEPQAAPPPVRASAQAPAPAQPAASATTAMTHEAQNGVIKQYCVGCHNDNLKKGELSLAGFDAGRAADRADIAEKMVRKLRTGMMPPKEAARKPDVATRLALVSALETTLDTAAAAHPNPGRRSFQRLNRAGVRRRDPRAVRPRHRRQHLSARRHDQRELRQHRRRADAVRDGDAGLHARRGVRQPSRGRRSVR